MVCNQHFGVSVIFGLKHFGVSVKMVAFLLRINRLLDCGKDVPFMGREVYLVVEAEPFGDEVEEGDECDSDT